MYEKSELQTRKKGERFRSNRGLFIQSGVKAGMVDRTPSEPAGMVGYPYWALDICPAIPNKKIV